MEEDENRAYYTEGVHADNKCRIVNFVDEDGERMTVIEIFDGEVYDEGDPLDVPKGHVVRTADVFEA